MSDCLKGSICFQLDCSFCQAFCRSAIIISTILQILLSGLFPTQMKVRGQGYWRWASSLPCLLFELVFWLYELLAQLNWNMFSYRCAELVWFCLFVFWFGLFFLCSRWFLHCFSSHLLLSDGDALWRDCAWEEQSCFCMSKLTDSLRCVPETKGSGISGCIMARVGALQQSSLLGNNSYQNNSVLCRASRSMLYTLC